MKRKITVCVPIGFKRCCTCKEIIPITCFNKSRSREDGLKQSCRECQKKEKKKYRDKLKKLGFKIGSKSKCKDTITRLLKDVSLYKSKFNLARLNYIRALGKLIKARKDEFYSQLEDNNREVFDQEIYVYDADSKDPIENILNDNAASTIRKML